MRLSTKTVIPLTLLFFCFGACQVASISGATLDKAMRYWHQGMASDGAGRSTVVAKAPLVSRLPLPAKGLFHGAFAGDLLPSMPPSQVQRVIYDFEALAGKDLALVNFFILHGPFPHGVVAAIQQTGALPVVSLSAGPSNLAEIVAGRDDASYREFARGAKEYGEPLLIRWGWEMNGTHYSWSGYRNGANHEAAQRFVQAWRHVVELFRREGADNVLWVWCVDAWGRGPSDGQPGKWNHFANYYPGDDVVDWVGADGYNWPNANYHTFSEIFDDPWLAAGCLSRLHQYGKPIMIGETASSNAHARSPEWIRDAFSTLTSVRYPHLKAMLWFNKNQDGADWQLKPWTPATEAYRTGVSHPAWVDEGLR